MNLTNQIHRRIKMIKRKLFGHANFDLLRKLILLRV
jgi:transposase